MFGPKQYLRTTDSVNVFTDNFRGVHGKGTLIIQNGDGNGHHLVSDLLIQINGVPLPGWSWLMQPGYKLEAPILMDDDNSILVIILGKPGSYLTIQEEAEITPDATTTQVIGIAGGMASVQNHLGDTFTLTIPPLALDQDTAISISALPNALPSPIANNLYPGVVLGPEGLGFSLPVTATVTLHQPLVNPVASLLSLENSDSALPTANQTTLTEQNSIQGEIYHFSPPLTVGAPTISEITSQIAKITSSISTIATLSPECYPNPVTDWCEIGDVLDSESALLGLAKAADILDNPKVAANAQAGAQQMLLEGTAALLARPLPSNPCGLNSVADLQLAASIRALLDDNSLAAKVAARACKFTVSPPPTLFLFVGQTWNEITATLKDPHGNPRSCSVINWSDPNPPNVVAIAKDGMVCVPTGVSPGVAEVSANCDQLLASTKVSVCSLSGTYQGGYSGKTIGCVQRAPDGRCLKRGPKSFSGTIAVPFTQNGTSVSAVIMGYTFTGTNNSGNVTLGPIQLPCKQGKSTCPAGLSGTLSADCSTFSGSFYFARPRTITGTFSLKLTTP